MFESIAKENDHGLVNRQESVRHSTKNAEEMTPESYFKENFESVGPVGEFNLAQNSSSRG
jgi:hypothetical protein